MPHALIIQALAPLSALALALALLLSPLSHQAQASEALPPPPESIELHEATWIAGVAYFAYGKDFPGCAALIREGWEVIPSEGLFCETGPDIAFETDGIDVGLIPGEPLRLCHPDNYQLCSEPLVLEDLTPPPRLELQEATIEGGDLNISYAKDVEGCGVLLDPSGMLIAPAGILCGVGEGQTSAIPLEVTAAYPGLLVMLCMEGGEVCGDPIPVEAAEGGGGCEGEGAQYSAFFMGNGLLLLGVPALRRRRRDRQPYHRRYI